MLWTISVCIVGVSNWSKRVGHYHKSWVMTPLLFSCGQLGFNWSELRWIEASFFKRRRDFRPLKCKVSMVLWGAWTTKKISLAVKLSQKSWGQFVALLLFGPWLNHNRQSSTKWISFQLPQNFSLQAIALWPARHLKGTSIKDVKKGRVFYGRSYGDIHKLRRQARGEEVS